MPQPAVLQTTPTINLRIFPQEVADLARKMARGAKQETIGERMARLRRERGLTQMELAEELGVAQPVVSDYERGELRLHGQLIVELSRVLNVSADELLGLEKPRRNGALKNRQLLRRLKQLDRLPKRDQQALLRTIDAFLSKVS
jgi:transcriptional regulator with XRE-family HTH domain